MMSREREKARKHILDIQLYGYFCLISERKTNKKKEYFIQNISYIIKFHLILIILMTKSNHCSH